MSWWLVSHASCQDMFCLLTVSSLLLRLLLFFSPLCPCFLLSCPCLFTFTLDGNHRLQEDAARNKAVLSFFFILSFLSFPLRWNAGGRACLGFPNSRLCWGSLESNPAIIAGWSGLASAGEGKWIACYGAFQTQTPYKAFVDYIVMYLLVFTPDLQIIQRVWWRTKVEKCFVAFSHKNTAASVL